MLESLIPILVEHDTYFESYWSKQTDVQKKTYTDFVNSIDLGEIPRDKTLLDLARMSMSIVQRKTYKIPERDHRHMVRRKGYSGFVGNPGSQQRIFLDYENAISQHLKKCGLEKSSRVYGNIKSQAKINQFVRKNNFKDAKYLDSTQMLWDIVRFRIVTADLLTLIEVCFSIWETHFSNIVRCRNYYFWPLFGLDESTYRAVHFNLSLFGSEPVEIQVMTEGRNKLCYLDYYFLYNRYTDVHHANYERWIKQVVMKYNFNEALSIA